MLSTLNSQLSTKLPDPAVLVKLVISGGWILAAMGAIKVVIYLVGELAPGVYSSIRSDAIRRFLTGKSNRLIFGLGGFLTFLLGLVFVFLGVLLGYVERLR